MKKRKRKILVKGIGASAGAATGKVVVINEISEFKKMKDGAVLVCPITSPSWTMVMVKACAIVTDMGGMLSHPAIVCREFGIPSVVGTRGGTNVLHDGMKIFVDGTKGEVYEEK